MSLSILTHTSNAKSDLTFNISFIISLIVTKFEHKKDKSFLNKGALLFMTNIDIVSPSMRPRTRGVSKKNEAIVSIGCVRQLH